MPSIARITPRPFRLPLRSALRWGASSELAALEHVLLEVELTDGAIGRAEVPPRPTIYGETVGSVLAGLDYLRPRLLGLDPEDTDGLQRTLEAFPFNHTLKGGLDTAIWDAWAASQGLTLAQVLEPKHQRVRVSYILGMADEQEMLTDAQAVYEQGVRVFKVKVGRDLGHDLYMLSLLKERFADVQLYADANQTLNPLNAEAYLTEWAKAGLSYVEEPLPVGLMLERKQLRKLEILPIIADDSAFTPADHLRESQLNTFDVLNIKPARSGVSWSLQMLAFNRAEGKKAMVGSQAQSSFGAYQSALLAFQEGVNEPSELGFHLKAEGAFCNFPPFKEGWLYWQDLLECRFDEQEFGRYAL